jgi:hypothetical protein
MEDQFEISGRDRDALHRCLHCVETAASHRVRAAQKISAMIETGELVCHRDEEGHFYFTFPALDVETRAALA